MYTYKNRKEGSVDISRLINEIRKIETLKKSIATNDAKKLVTYNNKWEKHTQSNKDINRISEIQRMKIFLIYNIYAFTLGRGEVNEKLIFTVKKNLLFFVCNFFFSFLYIFFYLVVSCLFCFNFCFCTEYWLTSALIVAVFGTIN